MPWTWVKGQICEVMHWTFTEFDEQPSDVLQYFLLRQAYDAMKEKVSAGGN